MHMKTINIENDSSTYITYICLIVYAQLHHFIFDKVNNEKWSIVRNMWFWIISLDDVHSKRHLHIFFSRIFIFYYSIDLITLMLLTCQCVSCLFVRLFVFKYIKKKKKNLSGNEIKQHENMRSNKQHHFDRTMKHWINNKYNVYTIHRAIKLL